MVQGDGVAKKPGGKTTMSMRKDKRKADRLQKKAKVSHARLALPSRAGWRVQAGYPTRGVPPAAVRQLHFTHLLTRPIDVGVRGAPVCSEPPTRAEGKRTNQLRRSRARARAARWCLARERRGRQRRPARQGRRRRW
jgi:hypothetical protein